MTNDLMEDDDLALNEDEIAGEATDTIEETAWQSAKLAVDPELTRKAEEKERKRWQVEAADEQVR